MAGRFTFAEDFPVTQRIGGWVVAGNDFWKKELISFSYQDQSLLPLLSSPKSIYSTDYYIPASVNYN
jgi:hypothetical protein